MKEQNKKKPESKALHGLEKELFEQKKQAEELKDTVQKVQADFENFAKRIEVEKVEFKKFAESRLIEDLLPVADSFNEAIVSVEKHKNISKEGLELLKKQFFTVLEKYGLKEIVVIGKKFDPHIHECMLKEHDNSKEDEVVIEELQKGYFLNDKVLRTTKVKINKLEDEKNE